MPVGDDLRQDVIDAQNADQASAAEFLSSTGIGRTNILDAFQQIADLGTEKHDNIVFIKSDVNFVDTSRNTRLIIGASTSLSDIGLRPATPDEIRKRIKVQLNADALTSAQFQTIVTDFLNDLVNNESFTIQSQLANEQIDAKISWE